MTEITSDSMSSAASPWLAHYAPGVDWHAPLPASPAWEILDQAAAAHALRPAIDFLGKQYTYAELRDLADRAAAGLQAQGLKQGNRVGLFLPNCPSFVIFYFAILKAGGVVVNFNPLYALPQIEHQIVDSGVTMMVTFDQKILFDKLLPFAGKIGNLKTIIVCELAHSLPLAKAILLRLFKRAERAKIPGDERCLTFEALLAGAGSLKIPQIDPLRDVAVLQYTGGTTGTPKGAMLSHANITVNAEQCRLWFAGAGAGTKEQEKMLGVIPLFHVFAMTAIMNLGLKLGAELILLPRFDIHQLIRTIEEKRPTLFPAVATVFTAINNYKGIAKTNLRSIKYCISGGAPLPIAVKQTFEKFTGCRLVEGYGLTETSPVTHVNPLVGVEKTGSIGLPVPGTVVEIVSLDDHATPVAIGERGEVCIRGPQVMLGYWQNPQETAKAIVAGRLHTGDVGVMDADGYVEIVDRIKDMIIAGGFNIYPKNVEAQLYAHPAIAEAVVAGVKDDYRGETVKAWVMLKPGRKLDADTLKDYLRERLSPIEMPKQIEFRASLPKTLIGKLDRKALLAEDAKP